MKAPVKDLLASAATSREQRHRVVHEIPLSTGAPLDADTLAYMEPRFDRDFSRVRVHADDNAGRAARALGSRAYTKGEHVVFATGNYRPHTPAGRELLAHELAHVVQQSDADGTEPAVSGIAGPHEAVAARTARAVVAGCPAPTEAVPAAPPAVQRAPDTERPAEPQPAPMFELAPDFAMGSLGRATIDSFELGSADLTTSHYDLLQGHAGLLQLLLKNDPGAIVEVVGHADASGSEQNNARLSAQRAEAARDALVAAGVDPARISAKGAGATDPAVKTAAANAPNRRVEVRLYPSKDTRPDYMRTPSILGSLTGGGGSALSAHDWQWRPAPPPGLPSGSLPIEKAPPARAGTPVAPLARVEHPDLLSPQRWFKHKAPPAQPPAQSFKESLDADPALDEVPEAIRPAVIAGLAAFPGLVFGMAADIDKATGGRAEAIRAAVDAIVATALRDRPVPWLGLLPPLNPYARGPAYTPYFAITAQLPDLHVKDSEKLREERRTKQREQRREEDALSRKKEAWEQQRRESRKRDETR